MNKELIKRAYQLGHEYAIEKRAVRVNPLGAKELIDIAMSPRLANMVSRFRRPVVHHTFPQPTKRLKDAVDAVNEAVTIARNPRNKKGFMSRLLGLFRGGQLSDRQFYSQLDKERLKHRMHQLFDAEDFDRAVQAQRRANEPIINANLDKLQLLRDAAATSGVLPDKIPQNLPYMERRRMLGSFLDSLGELAQKRKGVASTGLKYYLEQGLIDRVIGGPNPTPLSVIAKHGK